MMDPTYITAYVASLQNVFSTMMQLPVQIGDPKIKSNPAPSYDVSGIIGMSGDITGNIVISFPIATAERIVSLFTGSDMKANNPDFSDAIGELANMISGNAKGMFAGKRRVNISCPSVVIGGGHVITRPRDIPCIEIPATTDCGSLVLEIAIAQSDAATSPSAQAATPVTNA